jgi:hypothetical protein
MSDLAQSRLAAFQQLERLLEEAQRLQLGALQHPDLADADYATLAAHYHTWYAACLEALPDDLRQAFREAYDDAPLRPRLETYLARAREPNPTTRTVRNQDYWSRWQYPYQPVFQQLFEQQLQALAAYRQRLMDIPSPLPMALKELLANILGGRHYAIALIDELFIHAGGELSWWVAPQRPASGKYGHVWGWLDGILLHAPDRERAIVEELCRATLDQALTDSATARRVEELLASLAPAPAAAEPSAPTYPYLAPQRLDALRQLPQPTPDLIRLIRLGEELNGCMEQRYFLSAAMLTRAMLYLLPQFVGARSLYELLDRPDARSFAPTVRGLAELTRKGMPTWPQVNLGPLLNPLLDEIVQRWR